MTQEVYLGKSAIKQRFLILHSQQVSAEVPTIVNELGREQEPGRIEIEQRHLTDYLHTPAEFNTVLLVVQHSDDKDLWRTIVNEAKSRDAYVELILFNFGESLDGMEILSGGYYAYFERPFVASVLSGYVDAANDRINQRKRRYRSSTELNKHANNLKGAAEAVLDQLSTLVEYDHATISLISKREYIYDKESYAGKSVRTMLHSVGHENDNWWLLRPVQDDPLIEAILTGKLTQRVFADAHNDLTDYGWDATLTPRVNSWIVLLLRYLDEIVGLVTLDALDDNHFSYSDINEITIRQFANQAALTILSAQRAEVSTRLQNALTAIAEQTEQESILHTIAEEACNLVDGLYSYVVLPHADETYLEFKSASPIETLGRLREVVGRFPIAESEDAITEGQGITVLAYMRRKTVILDDCQNKYVCGNQEVSSLAKYDPSAQRAYKPFSHDESGEVKTCSNIAIPILDNTEKTTDGKSLVLGVINVEHENPCAFTDIQIWALEELARFAAIAVKTHNSKQRIQRLFRASNIATSITLPRMQYSDATGEVGVIDRLVGETEKVAGADGGVKIFERVDNDIVLRAYSMSAFITDKTRAARKDGHTAKLIEDARQSNDRKKRIVIPDIEKFRRQEYYNTSINKETIDAGHRALLCLPLWLQDEVTGVMWLHFMKPQQFTDEEIEELQLYADRAAIALRNDTERRLLGISEAIGESNTDPKSVADRIVNYVKDRFHASGVIFYTNDPLRRRLVLYASTIDEDGCHHMPIDKQIRYGEGLAGHHYVGRNKDGIRYADDIVHVEAYTGLPLHHQIQEDANLGKLHSLCSIRLKAPLNGKTIGILILNDEPGRTYDDSLPDILRFAELAGNLIVLIRFVRPNWFIRIATLIVVVSSIAALVAVTEFAPLVYQDQQTDIGLRILAATGSVLAGAFLVLVGAIAWEVWFKREAGG